MFSKQLSQNKCPQIAKRQKFFSGLFKHTLHRAALDSFNFELNKFSFVRKMSVVSTR